jgi:hypothetical protein
MPAKARWASVLPETLDIFFLEIITASMIRAIVRMEMIARETDFVI